MESKREVSRVPGTSEASVSLTDWLDEQSDVCLTVNARAMPAEMVGRVMAVTRH